MLVSILRNQNLKLPEDSQESAQKANMIRIIKCVT